VRRTTRSQWSWNATARSAQMSFSPTAKLVQHAGRARGRPGPQICRASPYLSERQGSWTEHRRTVHRTNRGNPRWWCKGYLRVSPQHRMFHNPCCWCRGGSCAAPARRIVHSPS
jgi:hypothetical protein